MLDTRPTSTANRFRRARMDRLADLIAPIVARRGHCRVLDIGGTGAFWATWSQHIDWSRTTVTCLNLPGHGQATPDATVDLLEGDARAMPQLDDDSFDLCFSNSVIEHVGLWSDMAAMAAEIRRLAPAYMVQTPNYWFPVEPHARTPFLHWLPEALSARIVMARRCGYWERRETMDAAMRAVQSARMIGPAQMAALFPDAAIRKERFCGMAKSLIAIRRERQVT